MYIDLAKSSNLKQKSSLKLYDSDGHIKFSYRAINGGPVLIINLDDKNAAYIKMDGWTDI